MIITNAVSRKEVNKMGLTKEEEEELKETQMYVVAGLSLTRPVNIDDVRWAVERGFVKGKELQNVTKGGR